MIDGRNSISDKALIEAIQDGDGDAAACLYHRHIDRVHRICYRIVLDRTQVADCVQEIWLKVFRNLSRFECEQSFAAWLNCVAARTAIDYYRKWRRHRRYVGIDAVPFESLPAREPADEEELDQAILRQRVNEALQEITVNQRTAFVLRYFEDMSPSEISRVLGCREGTVRTHIQRCLVALRARLGVELDKQGSKR
jgi:RNA polymerase sigma-70 factor (ECF subfamily)